MIRRVKLVTIIDFIIAQQEILQPILSTVPSSAPPTVHFLYSILSVRKRKAIKELFNTNTHRIQLSVLLHTPVLYFNKDYDLYQLY